MNAALLSFGMDIVILCFLGVTIYYALKLSRSLNQFRQQRQNFENVIKDLNNNITKAQSLLNDFKGIQSDPGGKVRGVVDEARALLDELKQVNQAGNSLAQRLEGLAERNRQAVTGTTRRTYIEDIGDDDFAPPAKTRASQPKKPARPAEPPPSFFIQDRDFGEDEGDSLPDEGMSQAEQELYEALQGKRKA